MKEIDGSFKKRRNVDLEALLEQRWHEKKPQREQADEGAVVVAVHDRAHEGNDDEHAQHGVE